MDNAEALVCKAQTTPQCSPVTMLLQFAEYILKGADMLRFLALSIANAQTIERDTFVPTMAKKNNKFYNWWMVLTRLLFEQYGSHGTIPGYEDARGDNVECTSISADAQFAGVRGQFGNPHKVEHTGKNDACNNGVPMYLLCWRQTMPHLLTQSEHLGKTHSNIYYRRDEGISIECTPSTRVYIAHGTDPIDVNIKTMLGSTVGTWELKKLTTQYIGPDNGLEHGYDEATALHRWTVVDNDNLIINKKAKISDNGWQWSSPITIMHSIVTITKHDDNDA
eukprot:6491326-Amphidinium_carterae.2